jgi:hypothetical protein
MRIISEHPGAWKWIHGCFIVGTILTIPGLASWAQAARGSAARLPASLSLWTYATGAVFWLMNCAFRVSVQSAAAAELSRTGAVPEGYLAWHQFNDILFLLYVVPAYLACAAAGWTLLADGERPRWLARSLIGFGLTGGAVVGFTVPFMIHVPLVIAGAILLRTRRDPAIPAGEVEGNRRG